MSQERETEPASFRGPFDQTGDIRDHEAISGDFSNTEVRRERGERIVGDLRTGRRQTSDERRLSRVRQSDESHVGENSEFEVQPALLASFPTLRETRCL